MTCLRRRAGLTGQVSANALPRRLHAPLDIFGFLVKSGRKGALLQPLGKLPASELKFVVDTAAGFDEMTWAQENVQAPLAAFGRVYDGVRYRRERIEGGTLIWPKASTGCPTSCWKAGFASTRPILPRWLARPRACRHSCFAVSDSTGGTPGLVSRQ